MSAPSPTLPSELTHLRAWLHGVFQEAERGLSWQDVLVLRAIEQGLVMAVFGGLLASAWRLEDAWRTVGSTPQTLRLEQVRVALERLAFGPVAPQAAQLLRIFHSHSKPL